MLRKLAITITGDFYKKQEHPKIRVEGHWLRDCGFDKGVVFITNPEPGVLTIRKEENKSETDLLRTLQ